MRNVILTLGLVACGEPVDPSGNIIAVGDSIFAWHTESGHSIPEVVAEARGQEVANLSVGGTMLHGGADEEAIPTQYVPGPWDWMLVDGGGNDLNDLCGCGTCDAVMERIISSDSTSGLLPDFVIEVADSGVQVAIMGYPDIPESAEYGFDRCGDELVELSSRQAALAGLHEGIIFVDAREVISGDDLEMFDTDHVHPSVEGSAVMGSLLAEKLASAAP